MKHEFDRRFFLGGAAGLVLSLLLPGAAKADLINFNFLKKKGAVFPYTQTEEQWRAKLGPNAYAVLRGGENERAGTSPLLRERRKGTYVCKGCGQPVFGSGAKVMSNDFPTFRQPLDPKNLGSSADFGIILPRTEIHCKNCGSHLGYKFSTEGNVPERWRYAINGISLSFQPA